MDAESFVLKALVHHAIEGVFRRRDFNGDGRNVYEELFAAVRFLNGRQVRDAIPAVVDAEAHVHKHERPGIKVLMMSGLLRAEKRLQWLAGPSFRSRLAL